MSEQNLVPPEEQQGATPLPENETPGTPKVPDVNEQVRVVLGDQAPEADSNGAREKLRAMLAQEASPDEVEKFVSTVPLKDLIEAFGDKDNDFRWAVGKILAEKEGTEVTHALIEAMENENWLIRHVAACSLAGKEGAEVTEALIKALDDKHRAVREAAIISLSRRKGPEVTKALIEALKSFDTNVHNQAFCGLVRLDDHEGHEVIKALEDYLGANAQSSRPLAAKKRLRRKGDIKALIIAFADESDDVQQATVDALRSYQEEEIITEVLIEALESDNIKTRKTAAIFLVGRKSPKAVKALEDILNGRDRDLQMVIIKALKAIPV